MFKTLHFMLNTTLTYQQHFYKPFDNLQKMYEKLVVIQEMFSVWVITRSFATAHLKKLSSDDRSGNLDGH